MYNNPLTRKRNTLGSLEHLQFSRIMEGMLNLFSNLITRVNFQMKFKIKYTKIVNQKKLTK